MRPFFCKITNFERKLGTFTEKTLRYPLFHYGEAARLFTERQQTLVTAYAAHPERFVKGQPYPPALPTAVWINPPKPTSLAAVVGAVEPVGKSERNE